MDPLKTVTRHFHELMYVKTYVKKQKQKNLTFWFQGGFEFACTLLFW